MVCCPEEHPHSAQLGAHVLAVEQDLEQDGHIDEDLDRTTHPELRWAFVHNKVGGLEDVAGCPQQHHLNTGGEE